MAGVTSVDLDFGDGKYTFHLDIPRLKELQEKTGSGPPEVLSRLAEGRARIDDVRESIRLGLIGGGAAPLAAKALVERYVDERPLIEGIAYATLILGAAIIGNKPPEADPGNQSAAGSTPPPAAPPEATDA